MADLSRLFNALREDKRRFLTAAKGVEFEDRLRVKLDEIGFNRVMKGEININKIVFDELKKTGSGSSESYRDRQSNES